MNDLYLKALAGENRGRPPVWIMRQAGRYLPSYQEIRAKHSLIEMFRSPEIIAEVTALPLELGVDAAILFSDITIVADALGLELIFDPGPRVIRQVKSVKDLIPVPARDSLAFVREGIELLKPTLEVPLIGFCGGPFTVATYLIAGGLAAAKKWVYEAPKSFHEILEVITDVSIDYLMMQIDAGVDAIQLFDSWAGMLAPAQFQEFCLPYLGKIVEEVKERNIPVTIFSRQSSLYVKELAALKPTAISFDWLRDLSAIAKELPEGIAIQGNLDPELLRGPIDEMARQTTLMVEAMKGRKNYIANLGHGVLPDTPVENVTTFLDIVKNAAHLPIA
ncbi:MAG: Uroporphyrinogen decarboxylase [Chlamydiae bacterium]|nr:Uroporphyrinogen decarboxylase [Chlamydiota bacterium]